MKQLTQVLIQLDKQFNVTEQQINTYKVLAMNDTRLVLDDEYYTTIVHADIESSFQLEVNNFIVTDNLKDRDTIQSILGSYRIRAYVQDGVDIKKEASKALKKYISDKVAIYGHGVDVEIKWETLYE